MIVERLGVENLDQIVVAGADIKLAAILVQGDPARTMANLHSLRDLHFSGVDDRDRIAFFVRHIGGERKRGAAMNTASAESAMTGNEDMERNGSHSRFH